MPSPHSLILSLIFVVATPFAKATLGEPISTVDKDMRALKSSQKVSTTMQAYTVHEMVADGNTIRQFATPEGLVFAVSWRGLSKPDLSVLFGSYFEEYKASLSKTTKQHGKRSASMATSRMVIKRGGHMRDQRGFAYVPSLVPTGLNLEDLE